MTADNVDWEPAYRHAVLRLGAVCGPLGGVGFVIAGALHGDLPGQAEDVLRYVAPRSNWTAVHLTAIVSALLWCRRSPGWPKRPPVSPVESSADWRWAAR